MANKFGFIPAALILGIAFIIGVILFTHTWHSNYELNQTISVTGSATKTFTSDIGYLSAVIEAKAHTSTQAFKELQSEKPVVVQFFTNNGFTKEDIKFDPPNSYSRQKYDKNGRPTGEIRFWNYSQALKVKSSDVQKIKEMALEIDSLVQKGITLNNVTPKYFYSKLDSLKLYIQSKAAQNAKKRAQNISKATGQKLGVLRNASMGVLQIRPVNSTRVSSVGIRNVSTIKKEIMGVVSAEFQIK